MALADVLDPTAAAALERAKRAVAPGAELTPELLLAAACHEASDETVAVLVPHLPQLSGKDDAIVPASVPVAEPLRPVLRDLANRPGASLPTLIRALLDTEHLRGYFAQRGLDEGTINVILDTLVEPAAPAAPDTWRASSRRTEVLAALEPWGRVLTGARPPTGHGLRADGHLHSLQKNLLKMRRPNALIVGQPGTGKTALVHEFARLIVAGDERIAPALRDRDVFELSVSLFRGGSGVVGEYEKRVGKLIRLIEDNPQVILFVDEIHQMLQSGMHASSPFSLGDQAFKQAIGKSGFSIIGATTLAEYAHYIQPDGALARRFGLMRIEPPTPPEALEILRSRADEFRRHYAPVQIDDRILARAIELSEDLLIGRYQPDKALDVLDEACAECLMHDPPLPAVTEEVLYSAIEDEIGHSVATSATLTPDAVASRLRSVIKGQDAAIDHIAEGFVAGLSDEWLEHDGPRRVFFFCGPTGTGKTETATQLATILGGGREAIIRVDCNTLMGSAWSDPGPILSRLLGVERGYVGYSRGEGGLLTKIRDLPEAVVLFDEIEKASAHIGKVLLQILDEGRVLDADGNTLDFRRAFIVFTTNAGARYGASHHLGFGADPGAPEQLPSVSVDAVKDELRELGYGEEFFGRHLDFVLFEGLTKDVVSAILGQQLLDLREAAERRGYALSWTDGIHERLLTGWTPRAGARIAFTILRGRVEEQMALAEVAGELAGVSRIELRLLPSDPDADEIGRARRVREGDVLVIHVA